MLQEYTSSTARQEGAVHFVFGSVPTVSLCRIQFISRGRRGTCFAGIYGSRASFQSGVVQKDPVKDSSWKTLVQQRFFNLCYFAIPVRYRSRWFILSTLCRSAGPTSCYHLQASLRVVRRNKTMLLYRECFFSRHFFWARMESLVVSQLCIPRIRRLSIYGLPDHINVDSS